MSLFEQACRAYFAEKLGREIGGVTFEYDEGYRYSSYTYEDPSFKVVVWDTDDRYWLETYTNTTAGEFLTELFAWESSKAT
ncbi:hypothetical protein ACIQMR_35250 [Streptomyces sp. NPDC091376]|uniref:hypothetical protein n=1 Tax=Streptomyces sp. NPDC091376 TaxID=3365994 RepID=UPI00381F4A8A